MTQIVVGPWIIVHVHPETTLDRMNDIAIPSRCKGLRLCLRGISDFRIRQQQLASHLLIALKNVIQQQKLLEPEEEEGRPRQASADHNTSIVSSRASVSELSLASQVSCWLSSRPVKLEQLRVETAKSSSEMLVSLIDAPKAHQILQGLRLSVPDPCPCTVLKSLAIGPRRLLKLTLQLRILKMSGVTAIADYWRQEDKNQEPALREFRLEGVDCFARENGDPLSLPTQSDRMDTEAAFLLKISTILAQSLTTNTHLRSFHFSGRNRLEPLSSRDDCLGIFAKMMETNLVLESFQFLWVDFTTNNQSSKRIRMYLKLNRSGQRKRLFMPEEDDSHKNNNKQAWLQAITKYSDRWCNDIDCIFYLLRNNPSLFA